MTVLHWCDGCNSIIQGHSQLERCPRCRGVLRPLTADLRPVFARERRILEFYVHSDLSNAIVWRGSRSAYYYVNGRPVKAPSLTHLEKDLATLREHLLSIDYYEQLDRQITAQYRRALEINQPYLHSLEDEAIEFIKRVRRRFSRSFCIVSFSGGKDSTVVSDLVRRALHPESVPHVFSDTTLEDPNTYAYVRRFQEQHPLVQLWAPRSDKDFFELVDQIGPPSRVMRWCCTIFKTGPINNLFQSFGEKRVLTFYGIRANESLRRKGYARVTISGPNTKPILIDEDNDLYAIPASSAKIGQQVTASPILHWSEFDVWLYILLRDLDFNDAYRWGFSRVGCWLCPMNSRWSDILTRLYFPEKAERWRKQLIRFARRIGKPDPEDYVDDRSWTRRFGGAGMENRFTGLELHPDENKEDTAQIVLQRPIIQEELLEFFKPLGQVDLARSRPEKGEFVLRARLNNDWTELRIQAEEGEYVVRVTVIGADDSSHIFSLVRSQVVKYQMCLRCTACASVCPNGAIVVSTSPDIYQIDEKRCAGCLECVTHFGSPGCLVAKSLSVYGESV